MVLGQGMVVTITGRREHLHQAVGTALGRGPHLDQANRRTVMEVAQDLAADRAVARTVVGGMAAAVVVVGEAELVRAAAQVLAAEVVVVDINPFVPL